MGRNLGDLWCLLEQLVAGTRLMERLLAQQRAELDEVPGWSGRVQVEPLSVLQLVRVRGYSKLRSFHRLGTKYFVRFSRKCEFE